jgi:histidyl-tRNA synthetase
VHDRALGAQSALGGGGRYDGLIEMLGGAPTPGVGFAIGLDRTLLVLQERGVQAAAADAVCLVAMEGTRAAAAALARELRHEFVVECDVEARGFGAQMKSAGKSGARFLVILGEEEWTRGEVALKDSRTGTQQTLARTALADALRAATRDQGETR